MRHLSLHASALNDEEYGLYTTCLMDLITSESDSWNDVNSRDDAFYEQITVSIREVRAWLRGRYSHISVATIDAILKYFSPVMAQGEVLSGGEFFAALRLVIHVQSGRVLDRSLAFVQAHPTSSNAVSTVDSALSPRSNSSREPFLSSVSEPGSSKSNPFTLDAAQQPPVHPSQRQDFTKTPHSSYNPFLTHKKSISRSDDDSAKLPPLPPRKHTIPTPPSRHSQIPPTSPSNLRLQVSSSSVARPFPMNAPPPPPPKPKPTMHVTSTLMKQSLQASKAAQTMKKAEEQLEKERVLQVLRSTSGTLVSSLRSPRSTRSPSNRTPVSHSDCSTSRSSEDREKPPLPQRRTRRTSPSISTTSLEQVALAVAPSGRGTQLPYTSSPFDSPNSSPRGRDSIDLPNITALPPPTHPDRKPPGWSTTSHEQLSSVKHHSEAPETIYGLGQSTSITPSPSTDATSPSARMYRSKSLHYQSHPLPPPPPRARKKRPESIQVLSNGEARLNAPLSSLSPDSGPLKRVAEQRPISHRRSSLGASFGTSASSSTGAGTESIQRTLAGLQLKAENALPKLEIARYKAEAGLSRRGFIKGEERSRLGTEDRKGLIYNRSDDERYEAEQELTVDSSDEFERSEDNNLQVRDDLKWPAGEGWKIL